MTYEELIETEEYKVAKFECEQDGQEHSVMIRLLLNQMRADKWHVKLKRWFDLQFWMAYCLIFNNRICRYFKYKNLKP